MWGGPREGFAECAEVKAKEIDDLNRLKTHLAEHDGEDVEGTFELGLELDPGEEEIINHSNPDLGEDGIF